jgi:DNA repair protein SbcC/Rad50
MKFKKVEIESFRAYRRKEDGTFSFLYGDENKVANLVAVYGPNGFGKTSFYDAVEWCMTNKIKRLDNYQNLAKSERKRSEEKKGEKSKQYILKNRDSGEEDLGKVKITFDTNDTKERKTNPVSRKGGEDYDYRSKEIKNEEFRDVILSQEGIDAFLREDKPEKRYEKFIEFHDSCKEANQLYKNLTVLITEAENREKARNERYKELKKEINAIEIPDDTLDQLNKLISILNEQNSKEISQLPLLDNKYSPSDIRAIRNICNTFSSNNFTSRTGEKDKLKKQISDIEQRIAELPEYFRVKEDNKQAKEDVHKLKKTALLFEEYKNMKNERETHLEEMATIKNNLIVLQQFEELRPSYNDIANKLDALQDEITALNKRKKKNSKQITENTRAKEKLELELNSIGKKLQGLKEERGGIESKFDSYTRNLETRKSISFELKANSKERISLDEQEKQANLKLESLQRLIKDIKHGFARETEELVNLLPDIAEKLKNQQIALEKSESILTDLEKKAANMHSLNELHAKIISYGKQYIRETKVKTCPLCGNNDFSDFDKLLNQIASSKILSQEFDTLAGDIENQKKRIMLDQQQLEEIIIELGFKIDSQIKEVKANQKTLDLFIYKNIQNEKRYIERLESIDSQIKQFDIFYKDRKKEEIIMSLDKQVEQLEKKKQASTESLSKIEKAESYLLGKKIDFQKDIALSKEEAENLQNSRDYTDYKDLIRLNTFLEELDHIEVNAKVKELREEEDNLKKILEEMRKDIDRLAKVLSQVTEDDVSKRLNEAKKRLSENEFIITIYEARLKMHFGVEFPEDINAGLEAKITEISGKIGVLEKINNKLNTLETHLEHLEKQLSINDLKKELINLEKKKEKLKSVKGKLERNRNELTKYLESLINNFFEKKLINDIYRRIDPHPEYKEIDFKADLSDSPPRLYLYVEKDGDIMAPNLFLSTAQINILSLSIFLARALNAKDDQGNSIDTIFIDDPIQSMDSINVLSVIDLFRTIIHQHKKQLIVSTHDENFFNLLKKKIPSAYYPSKFLEFETFGKVKDSPER